MITFHQIICRQYQGTEIVWYSTKVLPADDLAEYGNNGFTKKVSRIKKIIHSEENHQHTSSLQINIQKLFFSLQQIMHLNWSRLQKHVCRMFLFLCIVYLISETNYKNVIRIQCLNLLRLRESILLKLLKEEKKSCMKAVCLKSRKECDFFSFFTLNLSKFIWKQVNKYLQLDFGCKKNFNYKF